MKKPKILLSLQGNQVDYSNLTKEEQHLLIAIAEGEKNLEEKNILTIQEVFQALKSNS